MTTDPAAEKLTTTLFDYHRVGYDRRPMTFLPIGAVGKGAALYEIFWKLLPDEKGGSVLEISSYTETTCRLKEGPDKVWRGNWLDRGKMPIELAPIERITPAAHHAARDPRTTKARAAAIDVAIMTVSRPTPYIYKLIDSLGAQFPLRLVVGSRDIGYLKRYRSSPFIKIVRPGITEWWRFKKRIVHHRASWNYWRTLTLGFKDPDRKGLLVLEDDVVPCQGWEKRFHETVRQIEARHDGLYALALFDSIIPARPKNDGGYYVPYLANIFYGTQAMYYPDAVRAGFADYLKQRGVDSYRTPYDLLFKEYARKEGVMLFSSVPSLFQHVGETSTGLGRFHQASDFHPII
jgi:hypothetical protein